MSNFNDSVFIGHIFLVCIYISYTALLKLKFSFLVQIICELKRALYGIKCVLRIFLTNMAEHTIEEKKILCFVNTGFRVTH